MGSIPTSPTIRAGGAAIAVSPFFFQVPLDKMPISGIMEMSRGKIEREVRMAAIVLLVAIYILLGDHKECW